jgi:CheY-like chemotaxis protein
MKVSPPDLIVVSLSGLSETERGLFIDIQRSLHALPVLTVGTEREKLPFGSFYWDKQFKHIDSPVDEASLLIAACARLGIEVEEAKAEAARGDTRKKVLVVDDNAATLRSIKAMLDEKYNVSLANSGMKALTSIGKSRPDVVLLDYEMPVCDGRQTLEMIRSDDEIRDIPVIFLTSVNDREQIQAVITLRPAGYLLKPPVPDRLIETIEAALAGA